MSKQQAGVVQNHMSQTRCEDTIVWILCQADAVLRRVGNKNVFSD
jgi:hypothetical protein